MMRRMTTSDELDPCDIAIVAVLDSDHLRDLALDSFTTRPEIDHILTRLIFQCTPTWRLPVVTRCSDSYYSPCASQAQGE